jgi:Lon-like protease
LFLIPIAMLALVADRVVLPYYVLGPGPAREVEPLIDIDGRATYPGEGRLLLTAVSLSQADLFEIVGAWIDPARVVVSERDIIPPGSTPEEEIEVALSQMDTSKIDAAVVALSAYAGYPEESRPGVLVESVVEGAPADGKLYAGDLIVEVDGTRLGGPEDLRAMIDQAGLGGTLGLTVEAGGETREVELTLGRVAGIDGPAMGIAPIHNFPFPLTIRSGDIGGPSAGLMWTLGLVELLTREDLTAGRVVAGTGVITLEGQVGPIGGIEEKVVAAERAGATVFFSPAENVEAARSVADRITVVPVRTYEDAVDYLEETS